MSAAQLPVSDRIDNKQVGGSVEGGVGDNIDPARDRCPIQPYAEHESQQQPKPEDGHRVDDDAVEPEAVIGRFLAADGGIGAEQQPAAQGDDGGRDDQLEGGRKPLAEFVDDRPTSADE